MRDRTRSPFPGMDPYLEQFWGDVHHALCTYSRDMIRKGLPPGLIARIDERTIIESEFDEQRTVVPDVRVVERGDSGGVAIAAPPVLATEPLIIETVNEPVTEGFVQIIDTKSGGRIVTVIEFTSPANKVGKAGREKYVDKQIDLLRGRVSLVEVDLIRSGPWILNVEKELIPHERRGLYYACVTRGWKPLSHEVYPIKLSERLPAFRIPLRRTDPDVVLDLQALINQVYENGSYGYDLDYTQPPQPPLPPADAKWAEQMLAGQAT